MKVTLPDGKVKICKIEGKVIASEFLRNLELEPYESIIIRDRKVIPNESVLFDSDEIVLLPMLYGG